ncbi:2-amino-3,7-dideoxy-D-threo-hept-6-ulosonate synthase [Saccharothrix luteola]|uniref:2-amino-3,7-dideoxy-D-threo-hept-6-ulosonate synthase n=1 Tax=Saccharothrix luteola TaxID=2893018 RepID=UPI001E2C5360|nr:2-amino-3,7-dideoxy-D-threo-hept-6-ulosonate synthase [Saccharothrix luteola]MCC8244961.1 2-amino-4,5-dihydroxy-6-one-heptanoic acid-7-phosphate synthase [Saccharothrix luteola]
MPGSFAREVRLRRLCRQVDQRLLVVPLDHSVTDGPITGGGRTVDTLVGLLSTSGVDAVVLHKGSLRHVDRRWFTDMSLILHLSAGTARGPDPDAKYLVASVEEAMRLGADAVSVHVNVGASDEARQIADLAKVAEGCDRWNLPLLAMMYPRGPKVRNPRDPELIAHAATIAADLGADIVKSVYPGSVAEMADVVRSCPVPVIAAGGPRTDQRQVLSYVDEVIGSGAAGVAMGRNIFQADDPAAAAREVAAVVHGVARAGAPPRLDLLEVPTGWKTSGGRPQ